MGNTARKLPLPISNKNSKMALIHVARNSIGLDDVAYRSLLSGAAGVESAAELEYEYQFCDIMKAFENLGFKSIRRSGGKKPRPQWVDQWGGTAGQRAKIEVLWKTVARNPSEKALRLFIKRIAHVDHPRFMTAGLAQKVIIALEAMVRKASPKKGEK